MKKLLLTLATVFLAITASAETATWNFIADNSSFKSGMTLSQTGSSAGSWTITYTGTTSTENNSSDGPKFGSNNYPLETAKLSLSESDIPQNATIKDITFTVKGAASKATSSWNLLIGGVKVGETKATTAGTSVSTLTWSNLNVAYADVSFELAKKATKGLNLQGVSITYTTGPQKEDAGLSFPKESYSVNLGETFNAPILTNTNKVTVVYSSKIPAVATVDADGKVTINGTGETVITAAVPESDEKYKGSASYTLTVIDPNAPVPTDATFVFTKAGAYGLNDELTTNPLSISEGIVNLGIEIKSGSGYRIYNSNTSSYKGYELRIQAGDNASAVNLTISVPENYLISSIEFDGEAVGTGVFGFTDGKYTVSSKIGTWSPENGKYNTVTATIKAQAKVRTIKVSYVELKPAKMPVVSHNKNQVTITPGEEGAMIYYTVDGSDVDVANATLYKDPFAITKTTTVKAVAVVEGKANSAQHEYEAEYIAAPTAKWESKNTTDEHYQSGVLNASTMSLNGIHGGIIITITAPKGCALWYSLTQGESNSITKAPAMYANVDNGFTSKDIPLTKVESGKVEDVLVQKLGKLTYYSENAKGIQSHDVVVNFSGETGVEDIIADENNGEVEYFNLQGVRVANPENGVYIRRQGNKATKVLVK